MGDEKQAIRTMKDKVRIVEVGPRDGLQNIKSAIPTSTKIELISRLRQTGLASIELTSMVSPKAVPQLADARQLLSHPEIQTSMHDTSFRHPVLVPNLKGLDRALELGVKEIAVFISASEGFSKANINCTVDEGLARSKLVAEKALAHGMSVRGYVSCIFACPFDGTTPRETLARVVKDLLAMGCYEVSLGDTLGVGTALDVQNLLTFLRDVGIPMDRLAGHFHDTYGQAVSNIWAAYQCGLRVFDSSVAGLGGCPYCPGAKGNAATEDVVYLFERAGVETGVDLEKLAQVGAWISKKLGVENGSRAGGAIAARLGVVEQEEEVEAVQAKTEVVQRAKREGPRMFRVEVNFRAIWHVCHLVWRSRYMLSLLMGL